MDILVEIRESAKKCAAEIIETAGLTSGNILVYGNT